MVEQNRYLLPFHSCGNSKIEALWEPVMVKAKCLLNPNTQPNQQGLSPPIAHITRHGHIAGEEQVTQRFEESCIGQVADDSQAPRWLHILKEGKGQDTVLRSDAHRDQFCKHGGLSAIYHKLQINPTLVQEMIKNHLLLLSQSHMWQDLLHLHAQAQVKAAEFPMGHLEPC
ncbi:hypothetical protein PILCRDRAFT_93326 [Piloderma croceum F 1598]|uniref:Uncharacterized protein n=1 Tax=Piloderma croceum (strain F 1598) TaxID=765440 RepID=A0A0C3B646_PILCF|nr:hypothetical protein PILCRDRAFT_93326 [Piloderma croceum F 1598]